MILGLTGKNAAGKGVAAEFLQIKGFQYLSLSDVLRDEIKRRGLDVSRERLVEMGRELRRTHGDGYLAERILERLEPDLIVETTARLTEHLPDRERATRAEW